MKSRDISITIDQLILNGIPAGDRQHIAAALSAELEHSFRELGVPAGLVSRPQQHVVTAPQSSGQSAEGIGASVAQAMYRAWAARPARGERK